MTTAVFLLIAIGFPVADEVFSLVVVVVVVDFVVDVDVDGDEVVVEEDAVSVLFSSVEDGFSVVVVVDDVFSVVVVDDGFSLLLLSSASSTLFTLSFIFLLLSVVLLAMASWESKKLDWSSVIMYTQLKKSPCRKLAERRICNRFSCWDK